MLYEDDLTSRLSMPPEVLHVVTPYMDVNNNHKATPNPERTSPITTSTTTLKGHEKHDKYSLRPRSSRRRKNATATSTTIESNSSTAINEENPPLIAPDATIKTTKPPRASKAKQRPAPLSKYRRRTANARERSRMKEINIAFETLRRVVPQLSEDSHKNANEKLTKITTLRLAMKYISSLSATLNQTEDLFGDLDMLLESDGESLPLHSDFSSDQSLASDFSMDFEGVDDSLNSMDLCLDPLSPSDLPHHISSFDPFLSGFS